MSDNDKLTVLGHIGELRTRLIRSVIVVVITTGVSFAFHTWIFNLLTYPAPEGLQLQTIKLTEMIGIDMRIALFSGIIVAIPYLTFEFIMFVSPALTKREKKYVYLVLPWIALMFAGGVAFAYFVLVPNIIRFLYEWGADQVVIQPIASDYINVVTRLLLVVGLVFELPVVTTFLARLGVLKPEWLSSRWREAIIICVILAAIITPTIDPVNQLLVAVPLILLYMISYFLAKLVSRRRKG